MDFILFVHFAALLFSFLTAGALLGALFSDSVRKKLKKVLGITKERLRKSLSLVKSSHNPILRPGKQLWMAEAVLNPAALGRHIVNVRREPNGRGHEVSAVAHSGEGHRKYAVTVSFW